MAEDWCDNCKIETCRVSRGMCHWVHCEHFATEFDALRKSDKYAWSTLVALVRQSESSVGLRAHHTFPMTSARPVPIGELCATGATKKPGPPPLHRLYYGQPNRPPDQVVALMVGTKKPGRGSARIMQTGHVRQAVNRYQAWAKASGVPEL